jgi:dienelactone hydrolase
MHGSYPFCTAPLVDGEVDPYPCPPSQDLRQFEGFEEIATAWAERGYLTLVPDLSAEYNNGYGFSSFGVRAIPIADAHLDALSDGSNMPGHETDKADLDRLSVVGHSRGGPLAVRYVTDDDAGRSPMALVLLTPASMAPEAVIPETMPTMLITSECDGDVGLDGPGVYRREQLPWLRPAPTLFHLITGGTHNAFSTQLDRDLGSDCTEEQLLDPEDQRAVVADIVPDFLDLASR